MSTDMETSNPFGQAQRSEGAGALALQARENTEVMALVMSAKRFPRDERAAAEKVKNAMTRPILAEQATYEYARGGTAIDGLSIRAAEAISQAWGNMSSGWREVSREKGADGIMVSQIEAFCVDYESTNRESITFFQKHWRDTRQGGYALKDERDVYELCANNAARRKRACILAQIPGDVQEMAKNQAAVTLLANADTSKEGIERLLAAFAQVGVQKHHIEKFTQRGVASMTAKNVVRLKRIYASIRDEMSGPADHFDIEPAAVSQSGLEKVRAAAKAKRTGAPPPPATDTGGDQGGGTGDKPTPAKRTRAAAAPAAEGAGVKAGEKTDQHTGEISAADNPEAGADAARDAVAAKLEERRKAVASSINQVERAKTKDNADAALSFAVDTMQPEDAQQVREAHAKKWGAQ